MAYSPALSQHQASTLEYGKFLEIQNDSRFPAITTISTDVYGLTATNVYPKYAVTTYLANASDINLVLSAGNVTIGNVGLIDHTTGSDVFANVLQIGTVNGYPVGAQLVLPYGTTAVSGSVTVLNPVTAVAVSNPITAFTLLNPTTALNVTNTVSISTTQTLPVTVNNAVSTIPTGTQSVTFADSVQMDMSNRLRVVTPGQQWWYAPSVDKDGDLRMIESFTSTATSIFVQNYAATLMTSGSASTGSATRISRRRFPLRPGISMQWFGTLNWDGNDAGVVKRKGWFSQNNGMFFELSGGDLNVVVRRRLLDGTLDESRVSRSQFNGDKLDGTGPSGQNWNSPTLSAYTTNTLIPTVTAVAVQNTTSVYNVTFKTTTAASASAFTVGSKVSVQGFIPITFNGCATVKSYDTSSSTITLTYSFNPGVYVSGASTGCITQNAFHGTHTYFFDLFGGKTDRIRFGKFCDTGESILHTFYFDGQFGGCFINTPSLSVRKEIFNTQAVNLQPSVTVFGTCINTEASVELNPSFGIAKNNTPVTCTVGNEVPIVGVAIRPGEPYQRATIQIKSIGLFDIANPSGKQNTTDSVLYWRLLFNPGLSGVPVATNIGKASRQWAYTTSTALTGGINGGGVELLAGYAASSNMIDAKASLNFLEMGSNIDYTDSDKIVLMVGVLAAGSNTSTIVGNMSFIESM